MERGSRRRGSLWGRTHRIGPRGLEIEVVGQRPRVDAVCASNVEQ